MKDFLRNLQRSAVSVPPRHPCAAMALCLLATDGIEASELTWEGGITSVFQDADDSRVDSELTASADLFVTLPRSSGEWFLYIEASTSPDDDGVSSIYPTANADAGSVLDRDGDSHLQVSEFHYTFHMTDERRLMVGLVNPSAWLDRSRITNDENTHFLNGNFKNNATIEFPDYTLGAVMRWLGSESRPEISLVVASSKGISDLPDRRTRICWIFPRTIAVLLSAPTQSGSAIGQLFVWVPGCAPRTILSPAARTNPRRTTAFMVSWVGTTPATR